MLHVLAFGLPSGGEWILLALLGLLFFGKRLPEVGRSLGLGIVEFKKGLKEVENEVEEAVTEKPKQPTLPDAKFDPMTGKPLPGPGYKFDPYTGKPVGEPEVVSTAGESSSTAR